MDESFESYRSYLFAIAYRMLGSAMDAEDMVQETWVRYQATPPETIRSLKAWLTTVITRLCMDQLQLAHRKREQYIGPWLPEPILTPEAEEMAEAGNPEQRVDLEESVSLAFLILLEQLQPFERAAFLLREVSATSSRRSPRCWARTRPPVAAPSAGRSSICKRTGRASPPRPTHTGNCSRGSSRRRREATWRP